MNLLSTGNIFTEIHLNRSKSTLIVGENGSGKSSIIEALTFGLYGKPFRNINKPQLVNSITNKGLMVEVEFTIGKKKYLVRRGMKPNIFEIYLNEKLLNQNADGREYQEFLEKNILKLNFKSFSQIVVLGSANYVPFMQLSAHARRGVVEDLLDIQVFSIMNTLLKEKIGNNKSEILDTEYAIAMCEQKIELHQKHIIDLKQNNDELIILRSKMVEEQENEIEIHRKKISDLMAQVEAFNQEIIDREKVASRKSKLIQIETTLEDKVKKLNKEIKFFHDYDNCPTCKQGIDHDFKINTIESRSGKLTEVKDALSKLESGIKSSSERLQEIERINKEISKLNAEISNNNNSITLANRRIVELNSEIATLNKQASKIELDSKDLKQYNKELTAKKKQKEILLKQKALYEIAAFLLKDTGIKTKIIKQYIPVMNKLINKYLAAMDFLCEFQLDENFNEVIKSRYRDEFTYASFSEGEKARLNLALMLTWRTIAKLRNSAATNLLILDETLDGALDASGTDEFVEILDGLTADTNTFVISHRNSDTLYDKFHSVLRFEKHGNFSRIAE